MRIACGKESERPLSRFPLRGKAGAGGFPPRRRHAARQPKPLARIMLTAPPTRGLPPPCASPAGLQRRCTLRHKPDISLANKTGQLDVLPTFIIERLDDGRFTVYSAPLYRFDEAARDLRTQ